MDNEEIEEKLRQVATLLFGEEARYQHERVEALEKVADQAQDYWKSREYCERMSRFHPGASEDIVHGWLRNIQIAESNLFYALKQLREVEK